MWMLYAVGSSFFAGITAVLAKCGIKKNRFQRSDCNPDSRCASVFVADGADYRNRGRNPAD